ncbi:MAG TPA: hypothetical protein VIG33_16235 [Pseudobdellovibrionaceae bacterium]|jgi:Spy/CpxP family protein refolding chaperone
MRLPITLFTIALASTGIARAASSQPIIDLNALQASPLEISEGLAPLDRSDRDGKPPKEMPQSCKDAAITPEQKTKIDEAVYQANREKIQQDADLKLAFMNYSHTVKDATSDLQAGQNASTQLRDAIQRIVGSHLGLGTRILYEIVTPEQRAKTFECMLELHKKHRKF